MTTYGLLIFDGVAELDFVGPWHVFTTSSMLRDRADTAVLIAEHPGPARCSKGMRVLPDHALDDHPPLDVVLVPGGEHTRIEAEMSNPAVIDWIGRTAASANWVTSVCTGAFLMHAAGPARGRRVATAWSLEDALEARGDITVVRDARYVVDGNLVSSQGRLRRDRHGVVAGRPPPRSRSCPRRPSCHSVRTRAAVRRRRAHLSSVIVCSPLVHTARPVVAPDAGVLRPTSWPQVTLGAAQTPLSVA